MADADYHSTQGVVQIGSGAPRVVENVEPLLTATPASPSLQATTVLSITQVTGRITPVSLMPGVVPVFEGGRFAGGAGGAGGGLLADAPSPWVLMTEGCDKAFIDAIKAAGVKFKEAMSNVNSEKRESGGGRDPQMKGAEDQYAKDMEKAKKNHRENRLLDLEANGGQVDPSGAGGGSTSTKTPHEIALQACNDRLKEESQAIEVLRTKGDKGGHKISREQALELLKRAKQENEVNRKLVDRVFADSKGGR